jgi:hypothetical protein
MDYALLQGGANFLVVAKKGTDQRPALPEEVANLRETMRRASQDGRHRRRPPAQHRGHHAGARRSC